MSDTTSRGQKRAHQPGNPPGKRSRKKNPKVQPCVGSQDFGSSTSKCALAFETDRDGTLSTDVFNPPDVIFKVSRVPLRTTLDDPERDNASTHGSQQFEFVAFAGLQDDDEGPGLVPGREGLRKDDSIPLKTIFVWLAGIQSRDILSELPGGKLLMKSLEEGVRLNVDMCEQALVQHFRLLREMMLREARLLGKNIVSVVLSYPNYLCEGKSERDPDKRYYNLTKYLAFYCKMMEKVWPASMPFQWISECQATAWYICEPFTDANSTLDRVTMWREVEKLLQVALLLPEDDSADGETESDAQSHENGDREDGRALKSVNVLVVDTGSSSVGLHYQTVYFDTDGEIIGSQTRSRQTWVPGAVGGSHLTNERIREIIDHDLGTYPTSKPGHRAELLEKFEQNKHQIDYRNLKGQVSYSTTDGAVTCNISAAAMMRVFTDVFDNGLDLVDQQIDNIVADEDPEDLVVMFCGGSYINKGLRLSARERIAKHQERFTALGFTLGCLFLADLDTASRTAVACGAAMAGLRRPAVSKLLDGVAMGLQPARRVTDVEQLVNPDVDQYDEDPHAHFIYSKGCGEPPLIYYKLSREDRKEIALRLICDPNYYCQGTPGPDKSPWRPKKSRITDLQAVRGSTTQWAPLVIDQESHYLNGPFWTYDLGATIHLVDLPPTPGFWMVGPSDERVEISTDRHSARFELVCSDIRHGRPRRHAKNRKWLITVKSEIGSKLLHVEDIRQAPMNCLGPCQAELNGLIYLCKDCPLTAFCLDCFDKVAGHEEHEWERLYWLTDVA